MVEVKIAGKLGSLVTNIAIENGHL
jgi:hypothetical protein